MHSAMVAADELCRWDLYIAPGATAWERCGCSVLQSTVDDTSVPPILCASIVTTMIKATNEVPSARRALAERKSSASETETAQLGASGTEKAQMGASETEKA